MKKCFFLLLSSLLVCSMINAQGLKGLINKAVKQDSASGGKFNKALGAFSGISADSLSPTDIVGGLKQALETGAQRSTAILSATDGFFANAALKILMPDEAKEAEKKLRGLGFGAQVDNAILSMNRAAEDASKSAANIFINAIRQMNFTDAAGILRGGDNAATNYLKSKTTLELTTAFRPVIEQSLAKVEATKYWNTIFSTYNKFSLKKVNPDLSAYVTEKALAGMFVQVALEEQKIRKDPLARSTDLMKKVFAK